MIEIRKDSSKNRLYLKLTGFFKDEEAKSAGNRLIETAKKMRPGFDIINDITDFKPASASVTAVIKKVQEEVMKLKVGRYTRVVGANALGKMQFARTSGEVGYMAMSFATLQEAEAFLDSEKK